MGDLKVVLFVGLVMVAIAYVIVAIAPYLLAAVFVLAIARMLVRQSPCKDEAHSPLENRPGIE